MSGGSESIITPEDFVHAVRPEELPSVGQDAARCILEALRSCKTWRAPFH